MIMMKAITWLASMSVGIAALSVSAVASAPEGWLTNVDEAIELAKKENKAIMLEFTGSDWCPPCIKMKKEVFSKPEFLKAASEKFVLVHLDFPRGDTELREKNQPLAEKYKIEGYPTIILLDAEGKEITRFFASKYPTVETFLEHLDTSLEKKDFD
jgi:thioredoxin-related protein